MAIVAHTVLSTSVVMRRHKVSESVMQLPVLTGCLPSFNTSTQNKEIHPLLP